MRRFAAGVTLVTFNENGKLGGLTVSSFCSLSMDPPLVLICIDREVASLLRVKPDLGIDSMRVDSKYAGSSAQTPNIDDTVTFTVTVTNSGAASSPAKSSLGFCSSRFYSTSNSASDTWAFVNSVGFDFWFFLWFFLNSGCTSFFGSQFELCKGCSIL